MDDIEMHLLIIAEKEKNDVEAEASMSFIYNEFRNFVYNVILKNIHFTLNKEDTALTIMSNVFMEIWENPLKWEFNSSKHKTQRGGFKAYLSTIAKYKLLEELRKNKLSRDNETNIVDDNDSEWKWTLLDDEYDYLDDELRKRINLVDECLLKYQPKKQDIIRMYFLLYDDSKNFSKENIKLLEEMFETTWQNIRQTISRVKKDIKKAIESNIVKI